MSRCEIVIVGFRCADDIAQCVTSLTSIQEPDFSVRICENGGSEAYRAQIDALLALGDLEPGEPVPAIETIVGATRVRLRASGKLVHVYEASGNIGYAGAINAVLSAVEPDPSWDAIWILNPDTEVEPEALAALKRRSAEGDYGIVGSRIVLTHNHRIQMYGGRWRRWMARGFNIGLGEPADARPDVAMVESEMQYVCGASMYVTRPFIEAVGPMEEGYFLYGEEVDWCFRRGAFKLGYAHDSVIRHHHGATIGSNHNRKARSSFSVFLDERSKLLFTRRFYPAIFPLVALSTLALTTQYAVQGAHKNFLVALAGWFSGLKGETGFPKRFAPREREASSG